MKRQPQTETESWQTITYRRSVLLWSVVLLTRHGEEKAAVRLFHRSCFTERFLITWLMVQVIPVAQLMAEESLW